MNQSGPAITILTEMPFSSTGSPWITSKALIRQIWYCWSLALVSFSDTLSSTWALSFAGPLDCNPRVHSCSQMDGSGHLFPLIQGALVVQECQGCPVDLSGLVVPFFHNQRVQEHLSEDQRRVMGIESKRK